MLHRIRRVYCVYTHLYYIYVYICKYDGVTASSYRSSARTRTHTYCTRPHPIQGYLPFYGFRFGNFAGFVMRTIVCIGWVSSRPLLCGRTQTHTQYSHRANTTWRIAAFYDWYRHSMNFTTRRTEVYILRLCVNASVNNFSHANIHSSYCFARHARRARIIMAVLYYIHPYASYHIYEYEVYV